MYKCCSVFVSVSGAPLRARVIQTMPRRYDLIVTHDDVGTILHTYAQSYVKIIDRLARFVPVGYNKPLAWRRIK